ncbi:MAG: patatin-like phospholipase family protein [Fimbriimonadaceae bacterium]
MAFKILAFDGGGIRGVVSTRVLANLCADAGVVSDTADLLAGSSVGATNALALALGMNPEAMVNLYVDHAASIFKRSHRRGFLKAVYRTSDQRSGHLAALEAAGIDGPESRVMGSLEKRVLVLTFQLNGAIGARRHEGAAWRSKLFHNFEFDNDGSPNLDLDEPVIDVLLRSSAAPIAFPVYQGFADGGLVAINPSVCAIAQALNPATGGVGIANVRMISFGTGRGATHSLDIGTVNWGLLQWGFYAGRYGDRFIDAFADIPTFQAQQLLGERYLRLNPPIPPNSGVDRPSEIPRFIEVADAYRKTAEWEKAVKWVRRWWV